MPLSSSPDFAVCGLATGNGSYYQDSTGCPRVPQLVSPTAGAFAGQDQQPDLCLVEIAEGIQIPQLGAGQRPGRQPRTQLFQHAVQHKRQRLEQVDRIFQLGTTLVTSILTILGTT